MANFAECFATVWEVTEVRATVTFKNILAIGTIAFTALSKRSSSLVDLGKRVEEEVVGSQKEQQSKGHYLPEQCIPYAPTAELPPMYFRDKICSVLSENAYF